MSSIDNSFDKLSDECILKLVFTYKFVLMSLENYPGRSTKVDRSYRELVKRLAERPLSEALERRITHSSGPAPRKRGGCGLGTNGGGAPPSMCRWRR